MKLAQILDKSKIVESTVLQSLNGIKSGTTIKDLVVASYLSLAKQHHSSIILLIENNLTSSAASLARPLLESVYRGTWVQIVANDEECLQINDEKYRWKQTWELSKDIDNVLKNSTFHNVYSRNSSSLHGFTHGGLEQISRQINPDTKIFEPNFSDSELFELLNSSNSHLGMMLLTFSLNIQNKELSEIAKNIIISE